MLGGVVADFVKGPAVAALPADVREGVRLHRLIDGFTDRHPVVRRSVARVARTCGWFAGIVIDVYYDHVLARDWAAYSAEPLRAFADRAYDAIGTLLPLAPGEAAQFLRGFIDDDRLVRYATPEGIADTLSRLSNRIARRIPRQAPRLEAAMPDLLEADRELAADFHAFYPELVRYAAGQHPGANTDPPAAPPSV
jgi:acyl carrier protein phosphodiesterase